jgi:hypothetical protein
MTLDDATEMFDLSDKWAATARAREADAKAEPDTTTQGLVRQLSLYAEANALLRCATELSERARKRLA